MTTTQKIQQLEKEITELRLLFSALVPLDKEGVCTNSFITQMKKESNSKPVGSYTGAGSLLSLIK